MRLTSNMRRPMARLATLLAVALIAGACTGGTSGTGGSGSKIAVTGAWARDSAMVSGAGAAYMVITNTGGEADVLLGGSSPAAKSVEVHETVMMEASPEASADGMGGAASPAGSGGMGGSGSGPMLGMQKVDKLEIPANGSVELKPGSYHLMLIELTAPLAVGQTIDITLDFQKAGQVKVTAEVKAG
jgi:periplasmic copper chaperone A